MASRSKSVEYDANLLALAKPTESALTALGKSMKDGAEFYWQNKLNDMKVKLSNEELTAAQLKNEFDKENNPLTLETNRQLLEQSKTKTAKDALDLDTAIKIQAPTISKAQSDAKIAESDAKYADPLNLAEVRLRKAQAYNANANAASTQEATRQSRETYDAWGSVGSTILINSADMEKAKENAKQMKEQLLGVLNDPNASKEAKKQAAAQIRAINLSMSQINQEFSTSALTAQREAKAQEGLTGNVEDIFGKMDVKSINVVSGLRETAIKMNNLAERLKGIDPHFGATGRLGADTLRMLGTPQYAALKGEIFSLIASAKSNGDSAKFKAEMNALEQTYKNPYDWFGTNESLDVLLNTIAYDVQAKAQARVEANTLAGKGNIPLMQAWQDNIVSSVQPFRMGYIGKNNNTKISSFNAANSGQNTGASSNQPFVHNARAKPNDLSSFDNGVNVK